MMLLSDFISSGAALVSIILGICGAIYAAYRHIHNKGRKAGKQETLIAVDRSCIQRVEKKLDEHLQDSKDIQKEHADVHERIEEKTDKIYRAVARIEGHLGLGPQTSPG